jgi:hypothetical protein
MKIDSSGYGWLGAHMMICTSKFYSQAIPHRGSVMYFLMLECKQKNNAFNPRARPEGEDYAVLVAFFRHAGRHAGIIGQFQRGKEV